jgi:hypothetical protein
VEVDYAVHIGRRDAGIVQRQAGSLGCHSQGGPPRRLAESRPADPDDHRFTLHHADLRIFAAQALPPNKLRI